MNWFNFLILFMVLRTWLEVWFQGDLFVVLRANVEARTLQPSRLSLLWEGLICPFCHAHHAGVVLALCMLLVLTRPTSVGAFLWLLPQAVAFGWAAGHLSWWLNSFLPHELRYSRPRETHDGCDSDSG